MAPISYGQSNIPAPSFFDMFGKGLGESLGKSIPEVVDQFKKKKAMDELQQTLLSNPDTQGEVSTPLFQAAIAMKDPSIYIQGKMAGRDQKKELPFESYAGQIPGFEKLLKQGAIGPPTEAGVKPTAPTPLAQTKMTPEEARSAIGTYGTELAREQGKYAISYRMNPLTGQTEAVRFNTSTGLLEPIPGTEGTLPVPKTPEKPPSVGPDREAVANEMFHKSFYKLNQEEQNKVESQVKKDKLTLAEGKKDISSNLTTEQDKRAKSDAQAIVEGRLAPSQVKGGMNSAYGSAVRDYVSKDNPDFDFIQADANAQRYKNAMFRRMLDRTNIIIQGGGALDQAIKYAKQVNNPDAVPINALTGATKKAFSDSARTILNTMTILSADEINQVFGGGQGAVEYFKAAREMVNGNTSVGTFVKNAEAIRGVMLSAYKTYAQGTPEMKKVKEIEKMMEGTSKIKNYKFYAKNPKTGHRIGSDDQSTWYDMETGEKLK